jgi:serine/threonine protein kinase
VVLGGPERRWSGTAGFTAPEVVDGSVHAPSSDLYALGATLYALSSGHPRLATTTN